MHITSFKMNPSRKITFHVILSITLVVVFPSAAFVNATENLRSLVDAASMAKILVRENHILDLPLAEFPRTVTPEMEEWKRKIKESKTSCMDRWNHFLTIWKVTEGLRGHNPSRYGGYNGPWLEERWIEIGKEVVKNTNISRFCARFGQFVPLFGQFWGFSHGDPWPKKQYYLHMDALLAAMEARFLYAVVSQDDEGLIPTKYRTYIEWLGDREISLLIFSQGGYGHVPIPLLKEDIGSDKMIHPNSKENYKYYASFCGTVRSDRRMRLKLIPHLNETLGADSGFNICPVYSGTNWIQVWRESKYVLIPRGFGRSAFMLSEAIHMGHVPVYIWDDFEWLPYKIDGRWPFGVSVQLDQAMDSLILVLKQADKHYDQMRNFILKYRMALWSYAGVLRQIELFLTDMDKSVLVAGPVPAKSHR
jgi:hypothetical protein